MRGRILDERNPALQRYALGHVRMVLHALTDYQDSHEGELPERIELHPKVMQSFLNELLRRYPRYFEDFTDEGYFFGIPIVTSESFDQPRLISRTGKIQYL